MGRVFFINKLATMPEKRTVGGSGRAGQGGLPPVPNRTPWGRAGLTGRRAREPFNCAAIKGEHFATRRELA
jgi:hypothetical protein